MIDVTSATGTAVTPGTATAPDAAIAARGRPSSGMGLRRHGRLLLTLGVTASLLLGFSIAPDVRQQGSFTASGPPGATGCYREGGDVSGRHELDVEYSGMLVVESEHFHGDWDLAVLDGQGRIKASGIAWQTLTGSGRERTFTRVQAGEQVVLIGCNYQSAQLELVLHYWVDEGSDEARGPGPGFTAIAPGELPNLHEELPVTVVLVGYEPPLVDADAMVASLPATARPLVRAPMGYGIERPLGITYEYDYRVVHADEDYEDRLFGELAELSQPAPMTLYQRGYNWEANNVIEIQGNSEIPAVEVERWLAENPPAGVDTTKPTVFLLNWYGRPDFRHHVYVHRTETEPHTLRRQGTEEYTAMIAWGGTAHDDPDSGLGSVRRIWFHDLSAGPEWRTANWNVDDPDLDRIPGDDRRFPPIWEYLHDGFRPADALTGDLADLLRYVAIDALFTPSPLYPPAPTSPLLPREVRLDVQTFRTGRHAPTPAHHLSLSELARTVGALLRDREVVTDGARAADFNQADHLRCYAGFFSSSLVPPPGCYAEHPYPWLANMYVHNTRNRPQPVAPRTELAQASVYAAEDDGYFAACYGWADDDWRDGVQSFMYVHLTEQCLRTEGFTLTLIHEYGHHFGLSHPHDGYDSETGTAFGPTGYFYFAWAGSEVSSVMNYVPVENDFSQFDRDSIDRWMTAAYLHGVNQIAGILGGDDGLATALQQADEAARAAMDAFGQHDYEAARRAAQDAYEMTLQQAEAAGVTIVANDERFRLEQRGVPSPGDLPRETFDRFGEMRLGHAPTDLTPSPSRSFVGADDRSDQPVEGPE